jgi:AraC-like DNA-binding protein
MLGGINVEERLQAVREPWTSFLVEFPTMPKQMVQGREEVQKILFLCPQTEPNPTELCLALFGSQILMHKLLNGEATASQPGVSMVFLYAGETTGAMSRSLEPIEAAVNAPVIVARKANVVKTAHFVTAYLAGAHAAKSAHAAGIGIAATEDSATAMDPALVSLPGDSELWAENLPDITLVDETGATVHAANSLQDYRAEYACRYVLAHFHENINRDKMAEMVNLSPGYFSNLFRSEVGMSFSDYLIQVRVENAKCLLKRFDLSVEAISRKCGFNSLAHFSRTFKDRCGQSPLKYRKSPQTVS